MSADLLLVLCMVAVAAGAVAQAVTGMGFSLVVAPVLVAVLGPREGVVTTLVLAALSSVVPLAREGRACNPREVAWMIVPTLAFTPVVAWVTRDWETRWLALAGGVGIIVAVTLVAAGLRSRRLGTPAGAVGAGMASATLAVVGGAGGPAIGLYAANANWEPASTRPTLHWYFIIQNTVTALVLGFVAPRWEFVAALVVGTVVGMVAADAASPTRVRQGVMALSFVGGVGLVLTSL